MKTYNVQELYTKDSFIKERNSSEKEIESLLKDGDLELVHINGGSLLKQGKIEFERDINISEAVCTILSLKRNTVPFLTERVISLTEEITEFVEKFDVQTLRRRAEKIQYLANIYDSLAIMKTDSLYHLYQSEGKPGDYITYKQNH